MFLWDVATAKTIRRFGGNNGHTARINCVSFAGQDDSLVVSGGYDATVRIWDTRSGGSGGGKPVQTLTEAKDSVSALVVWEQEILTGSVDGRVRRYDVRMGTVGVDVMAAPVTSLTITRDGKAVLVGTLDSKIRLIDAKDGACLMTYKGHENSEFRMKSCLGSLEKFVVSGNESEDGGVTVWDVMTGTILEKLTVARDNEPVELQKGRAAPKVKRNVISTVAWKDNGKGTEWCCAGTDGLVTVYGAPTK